MNLADCFLVGLETCQLVPAVRQAVSAEKKGFILIFNQAGIGIPHFAAELKRLADFTAVLAGDNHPLFIKQNGFLASYIVAKNLTQLIFPDTDDKISVSLIGGHTQITRDGD